MADLFLLTSMYKSTHAHTGTYIHMHARTHIRWHTHISIHTCTYTCTDTHARGYTCTHPQMRKVEAAAVYQQTNTLMEIGNFSAHPDLKLVQNLIINNSVD